ncbi:hypothetical protein S7711_02950 [Stachybotrys chartarum IBT 7711]|uniref:NADP-dependent oxidoreductase domain-containing protein n=1 Tax=Stachybotrys chartarum (strain CBS 109288 / IBT 7711) TaxID=1280523 RepID=A0A084B2E4_STACB|nr:hypothetical protein S7711_02950 [Stachybotrys chartarum IBT 7711]
MPIDVALPLAPPPKSRLARYRLLSPTASVRVSPLCLGGMSFGTAWKDYMGSCDQQTTEQILDHFYDNGGNFIDTANNYQCEESELWVGEWMKKRGVRDEMVIATKYTTNFHAGSPNRDTEIMVNFQGNGHKSLHVSVSASLRKLQTDYIDILYLHWWDFSASIPELMQSLHHLVAAGKVLYLGISDSPTWCVSRANEYARNHGLTQFSVYQGLWNAGFRDFERDIIPMCRAEGMGLVPWGVMGSGAFLTEAQREAKAKSGGREVQISEHDIKISNALEAVANRKDTKITSVALAYVMAKTPYVFPLVGCRTLEHLKGNIEALAVKLSEDDVKEIDEAAPLAPSFPMSFLYAPGTHELEKNVWLLAVGGTMDHVPNSAAIKPQ